MYKALILLCVSLSVAACTRAPVYKMTLKNLRDNIHTRQEATARTKAPKTWPSLRVTTINLGMTDHVPNYVDRKAILGAAFVDHIQKINPDIVFIQELWAQSKDHEDFKAIQAISERYGYRILLERADDLRDHGLQILFRKELAPKNLLTSFDLFKGRVFGVSNRGGARGLLWVKLKWGQREFIAATTHLTAGREETAIRRAQTQSLHTLIRQVQGSSGADLVILGGDFNTSDVYPHSSADQDPARLENLQVYSDFLNLTNATDTYLVLHPPITGLTFDAATNPILAKRSSSKTRPRLRLDYIFVMDGSNYDDPASFYVESSELAFQGTYQLKPELEGPVSDHWGVSTKLRIRDF